MNARIASKEHQLLAQENAALRNENKCLKEQLADLQGQLDWLKKRWCHNIAEMSKFLPKK